MILYRVGKFNFTHQKKKKKDQEGEHAFLFLFFLNPRKCFKHKRGADLIISVIEKQNCTRGRSSPWQAHCQKKGSN